MARMSDDGRVAITGMGIISCLGTTLDEVSQALQQGQSGIVVDDERKERGFRSALTGKRPTLDYRAYGLGRKQLKSMDDPARFAYVAAHHALEDAGWSHDELASHHAGIVFGNDSCVRASVEGIRRMEERGDTKHIGSGAIFQAMNSTVTMNLSTLFGLTGANWSLSAACASGAHAIGQGFMLIRSGLQKVMLCGGAQEITWQGMAAFDAINAFSTNHAHPTQASRPFDRYRDGLVPSGGAACLILEDMAFARSRGARIYGEIAGYGFSSDGHHLSKSQPLGGQRAIQQALHTAQCLPEDIHYINAHATSTQHGDANEASAIGKVFSTCPPLSSTKSMTGHECWMAGASEIIYSCLMARDHFLAPNINFIEPDEHTQHLDIVTQTREAKIQTFLSNSFGFGGTNAALIVKSLL